jgi:DNA-binding MarR family transcriptional regulator
MELSSAPTRLRTLPSWLLGQAAIPAQRLVAEELADVGAHRWHVSVLAALDEFGPDSQVALGRRCGIDRSDMVALLNDLDGDGYVRRSPDPGDRRRNVVTISAAGRRRLAVLGRRVDAAQEALLAPLTPRQRADLVDLLGRVVAHHAPSVEP